MERKHILILVLAAGLCLAALAPAASAGPRLHSGPVPAVFPPPPFLMPQGGAVFKYAGHYRHGPPPYSYEHYKKYKKYKKNKRKYKKYKKYKSAYLYYKYRRPHGPRPYGRRPGHWEWRRYWVPRECNSFWVPGFYNRRGRWIPGHWDERCRPGHWKKRRVWVSHRRW
jgi:hypothetical protein